jgi:O-antigen ligase
MHRFEKILLWILRLGLILTLFTPLVYHNGFFFPYIIPRAVYFQIITEILFAGAITLIAFFPNHRPRWTHLSLAIFVYLAIAGVTTLTSVDPSKSFIGTIERSFGFFQLLHFGMLFFAASITLKKPSEWNAILGISLGISLYAALDLFIPMMTTSVARPPTVAGNPIFLAAYLIFHLFFATHFFTQTRKKWLRIFLGLLVVIFAATILSSGVRGAFVGLSAAIVFLLGYFAWQQRRFRRSLIATLLVLITAYALIFLNRGEFFVKNNFVLSRITNFSLQETTTRARFAMWKIALSGFRERPLVGWGRENYSITFNTHFDPSFDKANVSEGWEDRTHNIFLEELVNGGILGLAAYLFLLTATFFALRQRPILISLLIGYIVQNLFGVDNLNEHLPFFLLLAYANFLSLPAKPPGNEGLFSNQKNPLLSACISIVSLMVITVSSIFFTVSPALSNNALRNATVDFAHADRTPFQINYEKGKQYARYFPSLQLDFYPCRLSTPK